MNNYIIGIDGGGTKTIGYLFAADGVILAIKEGGFANFSVDEQVATANIMAVIAHLHEQIKQDTYILTIVMGVAGVSKFLHKQEFIDKLREQYHAKVFLDSDALIALYSLKKNEQNKNFILAIGGTGSAVITYDKKMQLIGGHGHILGDEGSAYHASIVALKMVINNCERKITTDFDKAIMAVIKANNIEDIKNFVYSRQKFEIAALAKEISVLAQNGMTAAIDILKKEGQLLAMQVILGYQLMDHEKPVVIGLRGGFILRSTYAQNAFKEELKHYLDNYVIDNEIIEPVMGAYYLGLEIGRDNYYS